MSINKSLIAPILLTFVNVLGFSLLIPVLPFIVSRYDVSKVWYGILLSAYSAALFFGAPFMGALSDYFGRKKLLLISHLGTLLSWFIFAIAYFIDPQVTLFGIPLSISIILFSRLLDGITGGNNSVVSSLISDIVVKEDRAKTFSIIGAVFGIGFMLGPSLGALTSSTPYGYLGVIIFASTISLATLFAIFYYVKDYKKPKKTDTNGLWRVVLKKLNVFKMIYSYKENKIVLRTLTTKLLVSLSFTGLTSIIPLYFIDAFKAESSTIALFLLVIGIYSIFNQSVIVPKFVKSFKLINLLLFGMFFSAIGFGLLYFANNLIWFAVFSYIFSMGSAFIDPVIKTILANVSLNDNNGEVLGLDVSVSSLGRALMPLLSSSMYILLGGKVLFILFALFFIITILILYPQRRTFDMR